MDRDYLVGLLGCEGEVFVACRQALLAGARFWVTEDGQPASELVTTYARRDRHTQQRGILTVGFTDAVTALRAQGEELVRLGAVDMDDPPYHFQLFLNEDGTEMIACLGLEQSRKARRPVT